MENAWVLYIILSIVLIVVAILSIIIGYFWASSIFSRQREDKDEAAYKIAQIQFQNWKEKEMDTIQKQTYDVAKGQAIQEMQVQVKGWQENELKQIRQQMLAGLQGEAIKQAQEQLLKWRSDELENAKRQMWDVLTKESMINLERWKAEAEKEIREDAGDKSKSVTIEKMSEHMVPYLPGFGFNPADARFIGSPIDMVVFDGLSNGNVQRVVFVEIKTGASTLSTKEKIVKEAIIDKKVEWVEVKANLEGPEVLNKIRGRKNTGALFFGEAGVDSIVPPPTPTVK